MYTFIRGINKRKYGNDCQIAVYPGKIVVPERSPQGKQENSKAYPYWREVKTVRE